MKCDVEKPARSSIVSLESSEDAEWHRQLRERITTIDRLAAAVPGERILAPSTLKEAAKVCRVYPMAVTPYYASLFLPDPSACPIRRQCVPDIREIEYAGEDSEDPLLEEEYSPVPGIVHRYPDRVLLMLTLECATYCRHCTRKRKVGDARRRISFDQVLEGIDYIRRNRKIRDVLLSGGDPLMLDDARLEKTLSLIRAIPHVEVVRIGTRMPVTLPQRITPKLVSMLRRYHPLWLNTHFNHPLEITAESRRALSLLADAGIPLGNQTVLLRGVNDDPETIRELMHLLVANRVRPYYLYQCDRSRGVNHFRTPIRTGIDIHRSLVGHTSGFAIPVFVVDLPGGGGKVPMTDESIVLDSKEEMLVRNFEGRIFSIRNPNGAFTKDVPGRGAGK